MLLKHTLSRNIYYEFRYIFNTLYSEKNMLLVSYFDIVIVRQYYYFQTFLWFWDAFVCGCPGPGRRWERRCAASGQLLGIGCLLFPNRRLRAFRRGLAPQTETNSQLIVEEQQFAKLKRNFIDGGKRFAKPQWMKFEQNTFTCRPSSCISYQVILDVWNSCCISERVFLDACHSWDQRWRAGEIASAQLCC